jgi:hypothetical protein
MWPGANIIQLFMSVIYDFFNDVKCLSQASFSTLV